MTDEIMTSITDNVYGVWFLIGAALVFFMQCGFAMVETGFTRAKNAGNIIMKNLMDFCIGTVVFILVGFGLLFGEDLVGIIGKPGFDIFSDYANFPFSDFVFNLVFCATAATIVSGAMAERTKFSTYCIYSAVISAVIYPVETHWVWGGGWLSQLDLPFHDFAGSAVIHMVGGLSALIGATILGPRIGKFERDKDGKVTKVNAIPGHSLTIGALGVFILWFGWYGFNGAAATSIDQLASIFVTTTIAPALATVTCMIFTWLKYGKPDVSMTLNGALAGLVAITAGCDQVSPVGAFFIGLFAGILLCVSVDFFDRIAKIDDPVGAISVHGACGAMGTLCVGLFATDSGLFYGGGIHYFLIQLLGVASVMLWVIITMTIIFKVIDKLVGLRVPADIEIEGLDYHEHGLASAYAGFNISDITATMDVNENTDLGESDYTKASDSQKNAAVKVAGEELIAANPTGMYKVSILVKLSRYDKLRKALNELGVTGMTVTQVMGCGIQKGSGEKYRGAEVDATLLPKVKVEVIGGNIPVEKVIETAKKCLYTGHIGDGKIFVYDVRHVVKVRTGEEDLAALKDVE